jgi:hypothetical protein
MDYFIIFYNKNRSLSIGIVSVVSFVAVVYIFTHRSFKRSEDTLLGKSIQEVSKACIAFLFFLRIPFLCRGKIMAS